MQARGLVHCWCCCSKLKLQVQSWRSISMKQKSSQIQSSDPTLYHCQSIFTDCGYVYAWGMHLNWQQGNYSYKCGNCTWHRTRPSMCGLCFVWSTKFGVIHNLHTTKQNFGIWMAPKQIFFFFFFTFSDSIVEVPQQYQLSPTVIQNGFTVVWVSQFSPSFIFTSPPLLRSWSHTWSYVTQKLLPLSLSSPLCLIFYTFNFPFARWFYLWFSISTSSVCSGFGWSSSRADSSSPSQTHRTNFSSECRWQATSWLYISCKELWVETWPGWSPFPGGRVSGSQITNHDIGGILHRQKNFTFR